MSWSFATRTKWMIAIIGVGLATPMAGQTIVGGPMNGARFEVSKVGSSEVLDLQFDVYSGEIKAPVREAVLTVSVRNTSDDVDLCFSVEPATIEGQPWGFGHKILIKAGQSMPFVAGVYGQNVAMEHLKKDVSWPEDDKC